MLNISEELSRFESIDVENVEQKIGNIPDDMKSAIELYNKALDDFKNGNEDIAIIALKKAIAIYPAFYEAMNLMGICYLSLDDEESARRMFNKVIQMDDSSIRASRYLDQLDGKVSYDDNHESRRSAKPRKILSLASWVGSGLTPERNNPYFFKYIVGFVLGVLAICLLWLVVPVNKPIIIDFGKMFSKTVDESAQVEKLQKENTELSSRLSEAQDALKRATETQKQLQDQMDQYVKSSAILRNLQNLADDGKYREVVLEIERNLAGLKLPQDIENEIIALNNLCKPKAIKQFYERGRELYNSNAKAKDLDTYQQSADEYLMAIRIMEELQEKPSFMINAYYYGGKAVALSQYPSKQEAEKEAVRCFEMVISIGPNTQLASYARARINEIEAGKAIAH